MHGVRFVLAQILKSRAHAAHSHTGCLQGAGGRVCGGPGGGSAGASGGPASGPRLLARHTHTEFFRPWRCLGDAAAASQVSL